MAASSSQRSPHAGRLGGDLGGGGAVGVVGDGRHAVGGGAAQPLHRARQLGLGRLQVGLGGLDGRPELLLLGGEGGVTGEVPGQLLVGVALGIGGVADQLDRLVVGDLSTPRLQMASLTFDWPSADASANDWPAASPRM